MNRALELVDQLDVSLIFSLKDVLCLVAKDDISKVTAQLIARTQEFQELVQMGLQPTLHIQQLQLQRGLCCIARVAGGCTCHCL